MFVVCVVLALAAVFLPFLEVRTKRGAIGREAAFSLWDAAANGDQVRGLVMAFKHGHGKQVTERLAGALAPRVKGRLRGALEDTRSAMSALDDLSDDDAVKLSRAVAITTWVLLGMLAIMVMVIGADAVRGHYRRWRIGLVLALAVLAELIGAGVLVGCREVAARANDELGMIVTQVGTGAYVLPVALGFALVFAIALRVRFPRMPAVHAHAIGPATAPVPRAK